MQGVLGRSYPFHSPQQNKLWERGFHLEISGFETTIGRLCPVTDRVPYTVRVFSDVKVRIVQIYYIIMAQLCQTGELASIFNVFYDYQIFSETSLQCSA